MIISKAAGDERESKGASRGYESACVQGRYPGGGWHEMKKRIAMQVDASREWREEITRRSQGPISTRPVMEVLVRGGSRDLKRIR